MQIFFIDLNSLNIDLEHFQSFLSDDEKARANRISFLQAKRNFICGRVLIKVTLAKILDCEPCEVVLKTTKNGRPEISFPQSKLHFNISHSHNYITLGVCEHPIGVDLEYVRKRNFLDIAEYFFDEKEFEILKNINSASEQQKKFYYYWTKKEAFIKCNGEKLFDKLTKFSQEYQSFTMDLGQDYIASIVVKKSGFNPPLQGFIEVEQILDLESGLFVTKKIDFIV